MKKRRKSSVWEENSNLPANPPQKMRAEPAKPAGIELPELDGPEPESFENFIKRQKAEAEAENRAREKERQEKEARKTKPRMPALPEYPPQKRPYRRTRVSRLKCTYCGRAFVSARCDTLYCSATCRTYASDERNGYRRHDRPRWKFID